MSEIPKASSSGDKSAGGATSGAKQTAKRKSISAKEGSAKVDVDLRAVYHFRTPQAESPPPPELLKSVWMSSVPP